ncbi:MAG: alanine racemase [Pyrinomonadaceae bacterium]
MAQSWEIENFLEIKNNHLHIDGVDAVELAREHGTPLFVFSEARIKHNIERLKTVQDVIDCPLKICYAAKAMSTMGILQVVRDAGIDIEVNSGGELWKALKAGFTGERIIFNGTSKEVWEIEDAINAGIYAIQVDSLYELSLIEKTAERLGKTANISLRLVPEIESHTHSGLQTALLTSKFGMMPDEAFEAFREYKDSPHLNLNGIHLHIGSQNPDPQVYSEALTKLFDAMLRIYNETGIKLKHVNLGGGFPVNYLRNDEGDLSAERKHLLSADFAPDAAINDAWEVVRQAADSANASQLVKHLTLLLEPGRSIIGDAGICLTTVRNSKQRPTSSFPYEGEVVAAWADGVVLSSSGNRTKNHPVPIKNIGTPLLGKEGSYGADHWLLTDAGFNILLSMETYKWYYHMISAERADESHDFPYKLAGPLCDGGDVYFDIEGENRLPPYRLLPRDIQPNEVLALLNCGAYSLAQSSQYNGRFLPAVVLIRENGVPELIRRRDDFEDLVSSDVL